MAREATGRGEHLGARSALRRMASVRNPYVSSFRNYHKREADRHTRDTHVARRTSCGAVIHSFAPCAQRGSGDAAEALSTARHFLGANAAAGIEAKSPSSFMHGRGAWHRHCCQEQLAKEKITFRDLDIIQHFLADNGCANAKDYICPCWFSFHSSEVHPATTDDHAVSEEAEGCSAIRAS